MPIKGSKALAKKNSFLGRFQANKNTITVMEEKIATQEKLISEKRNLLGEKERELESIEADLRKLSTEIDNSRRKLSHKKSILDSIKAETASKEKVISNIKTEQQAKLKVKVTSTTAKKRYANPTSETLNVRAKCTRRNETWSACTAIHGGSDQNKKPVVLGMLDTLNSKVNVQNLSQTITSTSKTLSMSLEQTYHKKWQKEYYVSHENLLRSLNVYYSHDVMGKRKYLNLRKANLKAMYKKSYVVNYVPYAKLSKYISEIDIGSVHDINSLLPSSTPGTVKGAYRIPREHVIRLAEFYLKVNENRKDKLKFFPKIQNKFDGTLVFILSISGDGAPGAGTSILLSFVNVGKRIASSKENFLLFRGGRRCRRFSLCQKFYGDSFGRY